ncbi:molybdate ABC transporter substrate-binding protein [Methylovulum psychrotolerans]|uniref:Molybdate ABC transporter substrate-binding protein n=1 Tax=Methylovulum psychrotolerans TaxID=1704499 RepID=A0A1Z4BXK2_9GAMM|nr:molybdate ABC transporter substrate-binding protein [Methylovulum psychrotolerans]ASF46027.1 molybdate ABC transporter substrate-binding protein [Methylovulum psychrotolerans]
MTFKPLRLLLIFLICSVFMPAAQAEITVLAAASLTNALTDIIKHYQKQQGVTIKTSFASSSVLAKQIENGLLADIFISADKQWMDTLYEQGKIDATSRKEILGNSLVLIAPKGQGFAVKLAKGEALANAFDGKLCTGETSTVPAGKYAKEALQNLAMWDTIKTRIVGTEDVRAALAFVERGECAAGIVYATDALISTKVEVVSTFPESSHAPIVYPMALISQSQEARAFLDYLSQAEAGKVFAHYGFTRLQP